MIQIESLSKSFDAHLVLNDINLSLDKGKVYGIVGENGAGKTTLFRCIVGLEPYLGTISSEYSILKNHIGYLETNPFFMSKITGWEYLKLLSIARNIKEDDFERKNIFDLPLNQYAETYSTGMKKKLALMGILLQKNEFYILDEPFNGVDIHSNMLALKIIHRLKEKGKTILISSHIFSTLQDTCDYIHLLRAGYIIKTANQSEFEALDAEMKSQLIEDKLDLLF